MQPASATVAIRVRADRRPRHGRLHRSGEHDAERFEGCISAERRDRRCALRPGSRRRRAGPPFTAI